MQRPVYLDALATTPVDPRVLEAMLPYFTERFGNSSSRQHAYGWEAAEAVERARAAVAQAIGATPESIVFTSGATESNNLALLGVARKNRERGRHLITGVTEHRAVLDPCRALTQEGFTLTELPVDARGELDLAALDAALERETVLVTLMAANNEIGTRHDLAAIAARAHAHGALVHTDAAQAVGKLPFDVGALGVDLASLSGHKLYGPKGIGALYVRPGVPRARPLTLTYGGGHEGGKRPGTLNVPAIVGLGVACELAVSEREREAARLTRLRDRLEAELRARLPGVTVNGNPERRLPGLSNLSFAGIDGEELLMALDGVCVSTGSACTTADAEPSHVLGALGLDADRVAASVRFGVGRFTTDEEIDYAVDAVARAVTKLRT